MNVQMRLVAVAAVAHQSERGAGRDAFTAADQDCPSLQMSQHDPYAGALDDDTVAREVPAIDSGGRRSAKRSSAFTTSPVQGANSESPKMK